jgi:hypothetical protein
VDYPLISGVRHEWSSVEIRLKGDIYIGVKSINYTDDLKPTKLYGTHPKPIGRTRGQYNCSASIEMYTAEASKFRAVLGPGYKEVEFDIVVSYVESGFETITDGIFGCRIVKDQGGGSAGAADGLSVPWDLDPMNIVWNDLDSVLQTLEERASQAT